ncbi:MAG: YggS family pyridoxal phosphate-dependent enzyme [Candidatus Pelagibacter sp.]
MHKNVINLIDIKKEINLKKPDSVNEVKVIAVSKTFTMENILPLIDYGHLDYGENKVQEAIDKWSEIKNQNTNLKLHMIGRLQTNKVKHALKLFDYIHSLDSTRLAKKISEEQNKIEKKIKLFIQINIGNEKQKSGIGIDEATDFYNMCIKDLNLNIIGLMCLPPANLDPAVYFEKMEKISSTLSLKELSMGMSSDFLKALKFRTSFVRIGSKIFGKRN